jgi:hypothetical protein
MVQRKPNSHVKIEKERQRKERKKLNISYHTHKSTQNERRMVKYKT